MGKIDEHIIQHLKRQDSRWTTIQLFGGEKIRIFNIAWGYDLGDEYAHITSNISPIQKSVNPHFFHTNEIVKIVDEESGRLVWKSKQKLT